MAKENRFSKFILWYPYQTDTGISFAGKMMYLKIYIIYQVGSISILLISIIS